VFGLGVHPSLISIFSSLDFGRSFHSTFALDATVQNSNVHNMVILLPWSPNMNRRMTIFAYLHVKPMFVVQMSTKQPFSHINVGASIDLTLPP
jgi:hypothetical protein